MRLIVNDNEMLLADCDELTLESLLENLNYQTKSIAVAMNYTFVPQKEWKNTIIKNDAVLDIVSPMQGG